MPLIQIALIIILCGVGLYLVNRYVPMAESIKTLLNVVVILVLIIWLLNLFGVFSVGPVVRR